MQIRKDLIAGVLAGNLRQIASAVRKGANVNIRFRGRTILLWAIQERHLNIVKALIRAGASVEARDEHGFTPLGHAASDGNLEAVEFLLKSGAMLIGGQQTVALCIVLVLGVSSKLSKFF